MSTQSYGKYHMFFNHLQELSPLWTGKILLAIFTGMFFDAHRDCQGSDPVHATRHCHVPTWDSPWLHIKIRDRREGQENHLSLGVQLCLLEQGFALNFSIPVLAPLHSSISSGGSTFPRLICKQQPIPLLKTSKKAADIFLKLARRPQGPFIFPSLSCRSI